ncbi:MAG: double zinc ribbon domain-containing protein [Longimicrobiales bacterium]
MPTHVAGPGRVEADGWPGRRSFSHPGRPCRACDQLVPHGANACPGCGASIMQTCACGTPLEPGWRYCPACIRPVRRV